MRELTAAELASVSGGLLDHRPQYSDIFRPFSQFGAPDGPPPGEPPLPDDRIPEDGMEDIRDRLAELEREQELNEYVQGCRDGFAGVGAAFGGLVGLVAGAGVGAVAGAGAGYTLGDAAGSVACPNDGNAREIQGSE